jgi:hypothetical protein
VLAALASGVLKAAGKAYRLSEAGRRTPISKAAAPSARVCAILARFFPLYSRKRYAVFRFPLSAQMF